MASTSQHSTSDTPNQSDDVSSSPRPETISPSPNSVQQTKDTFFEAIKENDETKVSEHLNNTSYPFILSGDSERKSGLSWAAMKGHPSMVKLLLDGGAAAIISVPDNHGNTPLHFAATKNDIITANLLIDYGAYMEMVNDQGSTPLYISAGNGDKEMVDLLLDNYADINAYNNEKGLTALHQAIVGNHLGVARLLLKNGASIEALSSDGETPLMKAAVCGNEDAVKLLLKYGAKKKLRSPNGLTAEDLAGSKMQSIQTKIHSSSDFSEAMIFRDHACAGFEASIVDFYKDGHSEATKASFITRSIQELLSDQSLPKLMESTESVGSDAGGNMEETTKSELFRWYHFPANNMEWVETLIDKLVRQGNISKDTTTREWKKKLALTNLDRRQYCTPIALSGSSFMRHMCKSFPIPSKQTKENESKANEQKAKKPKINKAKDDESMNSDAKSDTSEDEGVNDDEFSDESDEAKPRVNEPKKVANHRPQQDIVAFVSSKRISLISEANKSYVPYLNFEMHERYERISKIIREIQPRDAPEKPFAKTNKSKDSNLEPGIAGQQPTRLFSHSFWNRSVEKDPEACQNSDSNSGNRGMKTHPQPGTSANENLIKGYMKQNVKTSKVPLQMLPTLDSNSGSPGMKTDPQPGTSADENLIKGYMKQNVKTSKVPLPLLPLQMRRTLDQYFYTDEKTTIPRNGDQVVRRFTEQAKEEPKMFMVDQLWLWIINGNIIITCCPQGWDSLDHKVDDKQLSDHEAPDKKRSDHEVLDKKRTDHEVLDKKRSDHEVLDKKRTDHEVPGKKRTDHPPSVREKVEKQLRRDLLSPKSTKTITVYQLARLITSHCANVFDPFEILTNFQFFDFFESSIGKVRAKETECFTRFYEWLEYQNESKHATFNITKRIISKRLDQRHKNETESKTPTIDSTQEALNILQETKALIEIKDILDELKILEMVLKDQKEVMDDLHKNIFDRTADQETNWNFDDGVLSSHIYRIKQMKKLSKETYRALHHLLELKQKQANISGAEDATKQSKTLMVFTLVTVIFLPLSFVAAFFAINMDHFNLDQDGKLPMSFVVKYMLGFSFAFSVVVFLCAFSAPYLGWLSRSYRSQKSVFSRQGSGEKEH